MTDDIVVGHDITQGGRGILTNEGIQAYVDEYTRSHPPMPGMRWRVAFTVSGQPAEHRLEVEPAWQDAYAPDIAARPQGSDAERLAHSPTEQNRLGALAYAGWRAALPDTVREHETPWSRLPDAFRNPMISAAITTWQVGENVGYTQALNATLPSGKLGAAGELQNLRDALLAELADIAGRSGPARDVLDVVTKAMDNRVAQLRRDGKVKP